MATRDRDETSDDPAGEPSGSIDVRATLAGLAPPAAVVEVSAGFFHRTLARWLGLPEGKQPARKKTAPPLWDYDFWKAELTRDTDVDVVDARPTYTARLFRSAEGAPDVVRYWVKIDALGRIKDSGWLTRAPVLVEDPAAADVSRAFPFPTAIVPSQVDAIFGDTES